MRLQKMIAQKSEYSRRAAEKLIAEGKVYVNSKKIQEMGVQVTETDEIVIEGKVLYNRDKVYYLLNKPSRTISSTIDDKDRTTVVDLIYTREAIYPVGRLDYNTTGLLLLTNDGELANMLMHPSFEINKKYRVRIKGYFTKDMADELARGVEIDGRKTAKANVQIKKISKDNESAKLDITIHEGRNRQIRKMIEAIGCEVVELKRVEYVFFDLEEEKLAEGDYRELTIKEVRKLYSEVKKKNV